MSENETTHEEAEMDWSDVGPLIDELKGVAHAMIQKKGDYMLASPSSLVASALHRQRHSDQKFSEVKWKNRRYFFGAMYRAMGRALIDRARKRDAKKQIPMVSAPALLEAPLKSVDERPAEVEALVEALERLEKIHPDWAEVVRYKYYSDLTYVKIAVLMEISEKTVRRIWGRAEIVLRDEVIKKLNTGDA